MLDLTNPQAIKELLNQRHSGPIKELGQNFLIHRPTLDKVIKAGEVTNEDTILEIGPGLGVLTIELAKNAGQVIAVEQDEKIIPLLKQNLAQACINNVTIINQDILSTQTNELLGTVSKYKLIANIPYQITSKIFWKFIHEESFKPSLVIMLIQKEVANRVLAQPGNMSLLSVLAQYYGQAEQVAVVLKTCFLPSPKVDSAVIKISLNTNSKSTSQDRSVISLAKTGFNNRRKTLKNNLQGYRNLSSQDIEQALSQLGKTPTARAQEFSVTDWQEFAIALKLGK